MHVRIVWRGDVDGGRGWNIPPENGDVYNMLAGTGRDAERVNSLYVAY